MNLPELERVLLQVAILLAAGSGFALVVGEVFGHERWRRGGDLLLWATFLACSGVIAVHWQLVGHGPYITRYEVFLSHVWITIAFYFVVLRFWPGLRPAGLLVILVAVVGLGGASQASPDTVYLSPAWRSIWLIIHVTFAKLTTGAIVVGTGLAICLLIKKRATPSRFRERLPAADWCDLLGYKMMVCTFLFSSIMIISGSVWGHQLRQSYWDWDPLETWSLVLWLIYGLYLHLRITFHFKGERSAWFIIGAFVVTLFAFFLVPYMVDTWHNAYMTN